VGDNYEKPDDRYYGNNSVIGPDADHGTHVSGIVAASRNNDLGINGIADNVELMILRVVPDGDERDKDVANAVLYAVDNGANIINMSFGKGYSPFKEYVDKAFEYAADHGVLIVHAAGNDSENNDIVANYPTRQFNSGKSCETWIEVGALSWKKGLFMAAGFTNYGKKNVDIFAPGVDIYSTSPEQEYRKASGTSMSAPVVTGVAALVWSYYPQLSAKQLKSVILDSSIKYKSEKIFLPGEPGKIIRFGDISVTGGVVNAYRALKLAKKAAGRME
jgi:cell wall-associated protease